MTPPHDPRRHRELAFLYLLGPREWRQGAYDLYRPAAGPAAPEENGSSGEPSPQPSLFETPAEAVASARADTWIVDFKTHAIDRSAVERTARHYDVQVQVYREAAEAVLGPGARVRVALHFTRPNTAVER